MQLVLGWVPAARPPGGKVQPPRSLPRGAAVNSQPVWPQQVPGFLLWKSEWESKAPESP